MPPIGILNTIGMVRAGLPGYDIGSGFYLLALRRKLLFNSAQSSTNKYTGTLRTQNNSTGADVTISSSLTDTSGGTTASTRWYEIKDTFTYAAASTSFSLQLTMSPSNSPGTFFCSVSADYRLIG
jgi:hypothetical protein